ncbi:hypothetical protein [Thermoanaerobacter thermocopriae]|nr:hypothetical protein [Thermoanaerobacter thermocopriae]
MNKSKTFILQNLFEPFCLVFEMATIRMIRLFDLNDLFERNKKENIK